MTQLVTPTTKHHYVVDHEDEDHHDTVVHACHTHHHVSDHEAEYHHDTAYQAGHKRHHVTDHEDEHHHATTAMDYQLSHLTYHHHVAVHEDDKREDKQEYSKLYSLMRTHYSILASHLSMRVCTPK
jgi:hypothetical protein